MSLWGCPVSGSIDSAEASRSDRSSRSTRRTGPSRMLSSRPLMPLEPVRGFASPGQRLDPLLIDSACGGLRTPGAGVDVLYEKRITQTPSMVTGRGSVSAKPTTSSGSRGREAVQSRAQSPQSQPRPVAVTDEQVIHYDCHGWQWTPATLIGSVDRTNRLVAFF